MTQQEALYQRQAEVLKALAHPVRLRIVRGLLECGCRNVSCMERATGQSQSAISQHLNKLKHAGVLESARSGNEVYYEIAYPEVAAVIAALFGDREGEYQCTTSRS